MKKQVGKNTIGGGGKMTVSLKEYERSTHDLSYIWRSSMAAGTLVPFMKLVALRGDTWDINLEASVLTHPTIGPLFGSFKVQIDVFTADVRLYQGQLHNNKLGIGLTMNNVKLPVIRIIVPAIDTTKPIDNQQINPSCIYSYLGIKGVGNVTITRSRVFNAIPLLAYADIYKNYYANKQETNGWMIHNASPIPTISLLQIAAAGIPVTIPLNAGSNTMTMQADSGTTITFVAQKPEENAILVNLYDGVSTYVLPITEIFQSFATSGNQIVGSMIKDLFIGWQVNFYTYDDITNSEPQLYSFPLANIDTMRENILAATKISTAFEIDSSSIAPYGTPLSVSGSLYAKTTSQEGLFLKTYQSDILNNWMKTEWISGVNSVNDITKIDTSGGSFTIDTLTLKRKVYNMLNAIAVSGGSYYDWLDVNYEEGYRGKTETPVYHGGLSKEIIFQEVVSNAASSDEGAQPLGTLAGRGILGKKHKGGYVRIKIDEHSYVMGMISITPRIDYSQGNDWDVNLTTMDDFHKPALDGIGFQDLITEQMAWWDTSISTGTPVITQRSAGKQPAWVNYMTNYNKTFGSFAEENNQMFMTLNRRYQYNSSTKRIADITTYIDPQLYNHVFAYTKRDAQNFWVQLGVNIEVRRKMSAKIMPQG